MQQFQASLKNPIYLEGAGVHSGKKVSVILRPAPIDHGIVFVRADEFGRNVLFPAASAHSLPADLCTVLTAEKQWDSEEAEAASPHGGGVSLRIETIEHLMAALAARGLDNALIAVSGQELPILDGSAALYMQAIAEAGIEKQQAKRRYLRILRPVRVNAAHGDAFAEFRPLRREDYSAYGAEGQEYAQCFDVEIAFSARIIGRQRIRFALTHSFFAENLAKARTFGFLADAEKLRAAGLAQGANLENSVIIDKQGDVVNPQSLYCADAFVRHKALDAVGDTALLTKPFLGLFRSFKSGHKLNAAAVRALLSDTDCYEIMEL